MAGIAALADIIMAYVYGPYSYGLCSYGPLQGSKLSPVKNDGRAYISYGGAEDGNTGVNFVYPYAPHPAEPPSPI